MKLCIKILVLTFLFVALPVSAQKKTKNQSIIQKFELTTDHISSSDRKLDYNNTPCALVKVQATDDITKIEGSKIGDIVDFGGEKWVYMCKGSRKMKLHFANNLPVEVTFSKFNINSLESNRVYVLVVDTPNKPQQIVGSAVQMGTCVMKIYPVDTEVTIVGDAYGPKTYRTNTQGELTLNLAYGRYYCTLKSDGYESRNEEILIVDKYMVSEIQLNELKGIINIICKDKGSDFIIDGRFLDKDKDARAHHESVSPGVHKVEIRRKGKLVYEEQVNVAAGEQIIVNSEEIKLKEKKRKAKQKDNKKKVAIKESAAKDKKSEKKEHKGVFSLSRLKKQENTVQLPEVSTNMQQNQASIINSKRSNTVYLKMATLSELVNAGLVEKTSVFETKVTINDVNKGHMSPVSKRDFRGLQNIQSKNKPKILPKRLDISFELKETYKDVYELKILDSDIFWQDTDYLIIQL